MSTLSVSAHGHTLSIHDDGLRSRVLRPWRQGSVYERPLLDHIYRMGYEGTAVDVGGGIGNHAIFLAGVCGLEVVTFEPDPMAYLALQQNVTLNGLDGRIHTYKVPLSATLYTLDSCAFDEVALIKVDVEGMEPDVLRGSTETIIRDRPDIYAEEWNTAAHDAIADVLAPLGYEMCLLFRMGTPLGWWQHAEA